MAKITKSTSFKSAVINLEDMTITEITKDDAFVYDLNEVLKSWDGVEGVALSIRYERPVDPQE